MPVKLFILAILAYFVKLCCFQRTIGLCVHEALGAIKFLYSGDWLIAVSIYNVFVPISGIRKVAILLMNKM